MITKEDFKRVNNCVNGNPRYVLHYLAIDSDYYKAVAIANLCGGAIYRGKDYGGGIVFSTYSLPVLIDYIEQAKEKGLPIKATVRQYKGNIDLLYYDSGELVAWGNAGGHSSVNVGYYRQTKPVDKAQAIALIKDYNNRYCANLVYSSRLSHN